MDSKFENAGQISMQLHVEMHGNYMEMHGKSECDFKLHCIGFFNLISLIFLIFYLRLYNNDMCGIFD